LRFYLFERGEREIEIARESISREEREKQAPHCTGSLTWGSISRPWDHDLGIMT